MEWEVLPNSKTQFVGRFDVFINEDKNIIHKVNKHTNLGNTLITQLNNPTNYTLYKTIIENINVLPYIGKHIIKGYDVKQDGSYKSPYIEGYRLDQLKDINIKYLERIKKQTKILLENINKYNEENILGGDWNLQNLLYSIKDDIIYNVDLEGFFSYQTLPNFGNIDKINKWLNNIIDSKITNKEKVINILKYTKTSGKAYSAKHTDIGYHSIMLGDEYYKGQRDCIKRLSFIEEEINIKNKTILDIGCCTGGMLYPISNKIKKGIGLDFNYKNINACNRVIDYNKTSNLNFYVFDLEKEKLEDINNFYDGNIDITFLFSICMWINNWKELIDYIYKNSNILVIETNGNKNQQLEQYNYIKNKYKTVKKLYDKSEDDETQKNRKLYICKKKSNNKSNILINRENRQTKLVLPFLKRFIKNNNININLDESLIGTTHNAINSDIYVNLEAYDTKKINTNLYINIAQNPLTIPNITYNDYYHATWASISYYLRDLNKYPWDILTKPLKEIYNKKTKFCDYMFRSRSSANAIKRYKFYKILNSLKKVDNTTNDKRFSIEMYNDAVEQHKPYKFSISFENNNKCKEYITEKIINSFLAGSIPIYDGTEDIYKYFNRGSFINARDFKSLEELAKYVIKVDNDIKLYEKYINTPPTTEEKLKKLFWWEYNSK